MVLRVSWTAKTTNEWVLKAAGVERILLTSVKAAKMTYFGHILRKKGTAWKRRLSRVKHQVPELRADQRQHGWTISRHGVEEQWHI